MTAIPKIIFRKGKRVILRPILRSDSLRLLKWINDPAISQYLSVYFPMMEKDREDWIDKLISRRPHDVVFGIERVEGELIGTIELHSIESSGGIVLPQAASS